MLEDPPRPSTARKAGLLRLSPCCAASGSRASRAPGLAPASTGHTAAPQPALGARAGCCHCSSTPRRTRLPPLDAGLSAAATLAAFPTGAASSTRNPICLRQKHPHRCERGKGADERKDSFLIRSRPRSPFPWRPEGRADPSRGRGRHFCAAAVAPGTTARSQARH